MLLTFRMSDDYVNVDVVNDTYCIVDDADVITDDVEKC